MATFPQPVIPVFPAGAAPLAATFQGWIQQPFQFLTQRPVFRGVVQSGAGQSLTSGTFDALQVGGTAGDVLEDPYSGWSTVATSGQPAWSYLVPYTGLYEVTISVPVVGAAIWLAAAVQVSAGIVNWMDETLITNLVPGGVCGVLTVPCVAGQDYIQAGTAVSAATTTATGGAKTYPSLNIAYVSGG